jgi:anti-sigma regulatory factor (Ser/Thr protein kinase)
VKGQADNSTPTRVESTLPPEARSVRTARRLLTEALLKFGCADLEVTTSLLISEIVTNAVLHARTPLTVSIEQAPDGVRVAVADGSKVIPAVRHYSREATTGRGIRLVESMASSWGVEPTADGKTVWFVVSSTPADGEPDLDLWDDLADWNEA